MYAEYGQIIYTRINTKVVNVCKLWVFIMKNEEAVSNPVL